MKRYFFLFSLLLLINGKPKCQDINYYELDNYKINLHLLGIGFIDSLFKLPTIYQFDVAISNLNTLNESKNLFDKDNQFAFNYIQHIVLKRKNHLILSNQTSLNTLYTNNEQFNSYVINIGLRLTTGLYYNKFFIAVPVQLVSYFPHYVNFKSEFFRNLHGADNNGWQKSATPNFNYGLLIGITPTKRWDFIFGVTRWVGKRNFETKVNEYKVQLNYRIKNIDKK
ncbi:MAG: hypothetical protein RQ875_14235 [Vicingaceae bacterium]|nr:hypothetical protein [Vicingaceae bacterium]